MFMVNLSINREKCKLHTVDVLEIIKASCLLQIFFILLMLSSPSLVASPVSVTDLYNKNCAYCHGDEGRGDGHVIHSLQVKPTDFTTGIYKYRTTEWNKPPAIKDLIKSIKKGLSGTSMPAFEGLLTDAEIISLANYIKRFSEVKTSSEVSSISMPVSLFKETDIENGKKVYVDSGCIRCHGSALNGLEDRIKIILEKNSLPGRGSRLPARDLTDYRNYRAGSSISDIYTSIYTGLNGTVMTGYGDVLPKKDIIDTAAYLIDVYKKSEKTRWLDSMDDNIITRGDYLLSFGTCELCHTTMAQKNGDFIKELSYAGGANVVTQDGNIYSRNLTSDIDSGIGDISVDKLARAIKYGESPYDGEQLYAFTMPWIFYYAMKDSDAEAIAMALKRIPPIYNKVPPPESSSFWYSFSDKAKVMLGLKNRLLVFSAGNYGETDPVLGKKIADVPKDRPWSINPPIGLISAEDTVEKSGFKLPIPSPTGSKQLDAKNLHGRYIASITPCSLCHTPTVGKVFLAAGESLSGGLRISLNHFGTLYSPNLTSDVETGLGGWSDLEIRRALRSGIKRDGSIMHYMSMPWPMFANMTEADTEAIISYLRTLSAVRKRIPENTSSKDVNYTLSDEDFGAMY